MQKKLVDDGIKATDVAIQVVAHNNSTHRTIHMHHNKSNPTYFLFKNGLKFSQSNNVTMTTATTTTASWVMSLTMTDDAGNTTKPNQYDIVIAVSPCDERKNNTAHGLTKPEAKATIPKVKVKTEEGEEQQRTDNNLPTQKPQPQQMLDKAKADKVKMKETYKQAKLVLKQALNHYDICKFSTDSLTLT